MTYNELLANRVREFLITSEDNIVEKRMFGGLCFMVNDKMLVGVEAERMMVRVGPEVYEEALEREGCTPMDFTGKVMKGFVFVDADVLASNKELSWWINVALAYNRVAKASKKAGKKPTVTKVAAPKKATGGSPAKKAAAASKVKGKAAAGKAASANKVKAPGKKTPVKKSASPKKAAKKSVAPRGTSPKKSAAKTPAQKAAAPKKVAAKKTSVKGRKR
ncbi:TfoX/Sxy family protein [Paraflavitalea sp. CAU 1676]|uniref:TfoX/Sxy family protein n=1 Tax=Paraflavitalea sp. CAU 1676 TaxID=3032598 RepID=UPI0023DBCF68|nr:TfoX/Sxy family protein [Paraflavitalea sp. CAU 1676]MDF2192673.1 TfoX/Sxy family protein [Paraflavitalea sp. CAU 1676]